MTVRHSRRTLNGKPTLAAGYARTTINHPLSSVSGFYVLSDLVDQTPG